MNHPGKELQEQIKQRGWTQEDFAYITGYSQSMISNIIGARNGISVEASIRFGEALSVDHLHYLGLYAKYMQMRLSVGESELLGIRLRRDELIEEKGVRHEHI